MRATPKMRAQIEDAYKRMAVEAEYRPYAPSDGFGHITVPVDELDLDDEATRYAEHWFEEEGTRTYWIGVPDFPTAVAMMYAVEAARLCCSGTSSRKWALRVLKMAVAEMEAVPGGRQ